MVLTACLFHNVKNPLAFTPAYIDRLFKFNKTIQKKFIVH